MALTGCMGGGAVSSNLNPGVVAGADAIQNQLNAAKCQGPTSASFDSLLATGTSGELSEEQNENAQAIIGVAEERGLGEEGAAIGIATALVEADLINVDYGDDIHGVTNPDGSLTTSKGLFQQQDFWGPLEVRMDPAGSAGLFYDRLEELDWEDMDPGAAAQEVQGSAFPDKYGQRMAEAETIVDNVGTGFTETGADDEDEEEEGSGSDASAESASEEESPDDEGTSAGESADGGQARVSTASTTANDCSTVSGAVSAGTGAVTAGSEEGDDVPEEHKPGEQYLAAKFSPEMDPWGLFKGQCVSYVAWRLNVSMGYEEGDGDDFPFSMQKMGMAGNGNASEWSAGLGDAGYETDDEPTPGSVAWWDSFAGFTGEAGHVAIVEHVGEGDREGQVFVSQYNAAPRELQYSEQWVDMDEISGYIHVADYPDGETRIPYPGESDA